MASKMEIYKCDLCGNIVEVLHGGDGELVCCGQSMTLQDEKKADTSVEKHVPFIEKVENGFSVRIGQNTAHPMEEKHFIEWIELIADGKAYRQFLKPGDAPEALFCVKAENVSAREYCNVHGLWKGE